MHQILTSAARKIARLPEKIISLDSGGLQLPSSYAYALNEPDAMTFCMMAAP